MLVGKKILVDGVDHGHRYMDIVKCDKTGNVGAVLIDTDGNISIWDHRYVRIVMDEGNKK